ncbi:hypothetical protein MBGDN05_00780, partial [Thermoplasmatales archaeon SCGC AB-539-N05]
NINKNYECLDTMAQEKIEYAVAVIGGIGLGLLLGSEFSGTYVTLSGAGLVIISLVGLGVLSYQNSKKPKK